MESPAGIGRRVLIWRDQCAADPNPVFGLHDPGPVPDHVALLIDHSGYARGTLTPGSQCVDSAIQASVKS